MDHIIRNTNYFRPLRYCFQLSLKKEDMIVSSISSLLFSCCPNTVLWRIGTIVINSLYGIVGIWTISHISKEVLKFVPSRTNNYPSFAVSIGIFAIWITTSIKHTTPNSILCCLAHAMCRVTDRTKFSPEATATFGCSSNEATGINRLNSTTFTPAQPKNAVTLSAATSLPNDC